MIIKTLLHLETYKRKLPYTLPNLSPLEWAGFRLDATSCLTSVSGAVNVTCESHWNSKLNTKLSLEFQFEYGFKLECQVELSIIWESACVQGKRYLQSS